MTVFLVIAVFILFNQMNAAKEGQFHKDYLDKDKTTAVNGFFVILILLSHAKQYIDTGGAYDAAYMAVSSHLNQMVVASFLFYSGYGMTESVKRKKYSYVKSIMTRRFWTLFINFNLALVLYFAEWLYLKKTVTLKQMLLATIGWSSYGNSSWYIFAIFLLYILFFVSFFVIKFNDNPKLYYFCAAVFTGLVIAAVYVQMKMGRESYTYNTMILFALGVWWSLFKDLIEKIVMKNDIIYFFILMLVVGAYCLTYFRRWKGGIEFYSLWAIAFTVLMLLITMKVSFFNPILSFFGRHVFSIYILQRLPMYLFDKLGYSQSHKYMFVICCIAVTIVLAVIFDKVTGIIDKAIFDRKRKKISNQA